MTESWMDKEKAEYTPAAGANLVGIDDLERPGEMLYLVGHYDSKKEAERARKVRLRSRPNESLMILEPR